MMLDFFKVTPKRRKVKIKGGKGVIFSNPGGVKRMVFYAGTYLFTAAFIYLIYLYWPILGAYYKYRVVESGVEKRTGEVVILPTPTPLPKGENKEEYLIEIPKILAKSTIIENVSPYDKSEYLKILEEGVVAQAKGTDVPGSGKGGLTYIFAHSTSQGLSMVRKNAVFYLLNELKEEDAIIIRRNGVNYTYRVYKQLVVKADQIEYLSYSDPEREVLILQTCWPIGTNWRRMLIFAELETL